MRLLLTAVEHSGREMGPGDRTRLDILRVEALLEDGLKDGAHREMLEAPSNGEWVATRR